MIGNAIIDMRLALESKHAQPKKLLISPQLFHRLIEELTPELQKQAKDKYEIFGLAIEFVDAEDILIVR